MKSEEAKNDKIAELEAKINTLYKLVSEQPSVRRIITFL